MPQGKHHQSKGVLEGCRIVRGAAKDTRYISPVMIFKAGPNDNEDLKSALEDYRKEYGTYGSIKLDPENPSGNVYLLEQDKNLPESDLPDGKEGSFARYLHMRQEEEKEARRNGTWKP